MITAKDYLYHCWSGLTLVGRDEEGGLEWVGEKINWTAYGWLEDGVYEKWEDKGEGIIKEYLNDYKMNLIENQQYKYGEKNI